VQETAIAIQIKIAGSPPPLNPFTQPSNWLRPTLLVALKCRQGDQNTKKKARQDEPAAPG